MWRYPASLQYVYGKPVVSNQLLALAALTNFWILQGEEKERPSGLKPYILGAHVGTTEVVPFPNSGFC